MCSRQQQTVKQHRYVVTDNDKQKDIQADRQADRQTDSNVIEYSMHTTVDMRLAND